MSEDGRLNEAAEQNMTLRNACLPGLAAGSYTVTVEQIVKIEQIVEDASKKKEGEEKPTNGGVRVEQKEISGNTEGRTFAKTAMLEVSTPLFLAPSDIYDRYPPPDAVGSFSDTFPHVVLSRRTLPWERTIKGYDPQQPRPWLALLLLDDDELGEQSDDAGHQAAGKCKLTKELVNEPNQGDYRLKLEVPGDLFQDIAPSWDDLPYLAHVREVGHTKNMEAAGIDDLGWFSVVVCNRPPSAGKQNHVFLVSLEGQGDHLPGQGASPGSNVTLTVLANWRFVNEPESKSFKTLLTQLDCAPLKLSPRKENGNSQVDSALKSGYVPLPHRTGEGYDTLSWYRGPLVPLFLPTEPQNRVYPCAQAALRYDRAQGLFDVSYAAAWQLGRMLGLHDKPFAHAVTRLKLRAIREAARSELRSSLQRRFRNSKGSWKEWQELVITLFKRSESSPTPDHDSSSPRPDDKMEVPSEIRQWLGHLFLLHGVPFEYLVPHPDLLQPGSLRLFYLDTTWVAALVDGALSIGRTQESETYLDKAMSGNFLEDVSEKEINLSPTLNTDIPGPPKGAKIMGHITGFLLRSELVSGWRGVEIQAYNGQTPLAPLRMQRVTPDTLLAIYNGHLNKLVITQPPQGLHFGLDTTRGKWREYSKDRQKASRVLQVEKLAAAWELKDKPAYLAARLLQPRLQTTIEVKVNPSQPKP